jgi:hypothetical protein
MIAHEFIDLSRDIAKIRRGLGEVLAPAEIDGGFGDAKFAQRRLKSDRGGPREQGGALHPSIGVAIANKAAQGEHEGTFRGDGSDGAPKHRRPCDMYVHPMQLTAWGATASSSASWKTSIA